MDKLAIEATFVDYRRVKGRKVHQIIFEVPSERWPEAYKVLGEPTIDASDWFAIARMNGAEPAKLKGGKLAQMAGILSAEGAFKVFCLEELAHADPVQAIYQECGVSSRAHLDHDDVAAAAFVDLKSRYDAWLKAG